MRHNQDHARRQQHVQEHIACEDAVWTLEMAIYKIANYYHNAVDRPTPHHAQDATIVSIDFENHVPRTAVIEAGITILNTKDTIGLPIQLWHQKFQVCGFLTSVIAS